MIFCFLVYVAVVDQKERFRFYFDTGFVLTESYGVRELDYDLGDLQLAGDNGAKNFRLSLKASRPAIIQQKNSFL